MAQRTSPPSPAVRSARSTGQTAVRSGSRVGSRAADEAQEVGSAAADEAQEVASTASKKGQEVVSVAGEQVREVTGTVKQQAARVGSQALDEGRSLAEEAKSQLEQQAQAQSRRLADTLSTVGDEVRALADGRPDDATNLRPYVSSAADSVYDAADRLYGLASDIDSRGVSGVLDDLQEFARRRPGAFLLGAAVAGFGIGRAVRANSADAGGGAQADGSGPTLPRPGATAGARSGGAGAPQDRLAARAAVARAARAR